MTRSSWRQLARTLLRLANSRPGPVPARTQLDLMVATDHREAASRRTPWF